MKPRQPFIEAITSAQNHEVGERKMKIVSQDNIPAPRCSKAEMDIFITKIKSMNQWIQQR